MGADVEYRAEGSPYVIFSGDLELLIRWQGKDSFIN